MDSADGYTRVMLQHLDVDTLRIAAVDSRNRIHVYQAVAAGDRTHRSVHAANIDDVASFDDTAPVEVVDLGRTRGSRTDSGGQQCED